MPHIENHYFPLGDTAVGIAPSMGSSRLSEPEFIQPASRQNDARSSVDHHAAPASALAWPHNRLQATRDQQAAQNPHKRFRLPDCNDVEIMAKLNAACATHWHSCNIMRAQSISLGRYKSSLTKTPRLASFNEYDIALAKVDVLRGPLDKRNPLTRKIPICEAASWGSVKTLRYLQLRGAKANDERDNGCGPLSYAARYGKMKAARFLIDHGAPADKPDEIGRTPLAHAACIGDVALMDLFLSHGAFIEHVDDTGATPLLIAAKNSRQDAVRFLLGKNAKADTEDNIGNTALMYAVLSGDVAIVTMLAEHAKGPARDGRPYGAADTGHAKPDNAEEARAATLLGTPLKKTAYIDKPDKNGMTPLAIAVINKNTHLASILLWHGAKQDIRDTKGRTALMHARLRGDAQMCTLLKSYRTVPCAHEITAVNRETRSIWQSITSFFGASQPITVLQPPARDGSWAALDELRLS